MKKISVGELRQNPSAMLAEVEAGATYRITRHNREIGRIVPPQVGASLTPAKHRGKITFPSLPGEYVAPTPSRLDELLGEVRADH